MLKIMKVDPKAIIPQYQTDGAAGFDLHALEFTRLNSQKGVSLVRTGIAVELPPSEEIRISQSGIFLKVHYELQIRPRSGLAGKNNIIIPNSPGTVDPDYRGEIKILMRILPGNWSICSDDEFALRKPWIFDIQPGDRIAQAVVAMFIRPEIVEANYLSGTARGTGGFGHTGQ